MLKGKIEILADLRNLKIEMRYSFDLFFFFELKNCRQILKLNVKFFFYNLLTLIFAFKITINFFNNFF